MIFALVATGDPAAAQSGLAVIAPPGHNAVREVPRSEFSEGFSVASTVDRQAVCVIGFSPIGATTATQSQLNAFFATPSYADTVQKLFAQRYDDTKVESYVAEAVREKDGIQGARVFGIAKGNANEATSATILDTPKGRTNVACVGPTARFDALREEFEAITRGVRPPR